MKTLPCLICKKECIVGIDRSRTPRIETISCWNYPHHSYHVKIVDGTVGEETILYNGYTTDFSISNIEYMYGTQILKLDTDRALRPQFIGFYPERILIENRDEIIHNFMILQ